MKERNLAQTRQQQHNTTTQNTLAYACIVLGSKEAPDQLASVSCQHGGHKARLGVQGVQAG